MMKWINVEGEDAPLIQNVLIFYSGTVSIARRESDGYYEDGTDDYIPMTWVSHWMPLPPPPKEEIQNE